MRWRANIARVQRNRARPARPGTPRRTLRVLRLQCRAGFGIGGEAAFAAYPRFGCGCSSGVEHNLAKVWVVGSNPIARSNKFNSLGGFGPDETNAELVVRFIHMMPECGPISGRKARWMASCPGNKRLSRTTSRLAQRARAAGRRRSRLAG